MIEVLKTEAFTRWLDTLRDDVARSKIEIRILRLRMGNPGDVKSVGSGVSELRVKHGPGYRIYFVSRGRSVIILLCGGDKSSQKRDIADAKAMVRKL